MRPEALVPKEWVDAWLAVNECKIVMGEYVHDGKWEYTLTTVLTKDGKYRYIGVVA